MTKGKGSVVKMAKNMDNRLKGERHIRRAEAAKLKKQLKRMGLIK